VSGRAANQRLLEGGSGVAWGCEPSSKLKAGVGAETTGLAVCPKTWPLHNKPGSQTTPQRCNTPTLKHP
jgi:hypothetical protein